MHFVLHVLTNKIFGENATVVVFLVSEILALIVVPSILIRRKGNPLSALAWLLCVFSVPYLGVLLWWILGRNSFKRVQKFKRFRENRNPNFSKNRNVDRVMEDIISPNLLEGEHQGIFYPTNGNKVSICSNGPEFFSTIEKAILEAKKDIKLLYYIWKTDATGMKIRDLLVEKAKQGVSVQIVVDNVGSLSFLGSFSKPLRDAGAKVSGFLPPKFWPWAPTFNFRNHRKLLCIDGRISFLGGINIGDEYKNQWRDVAIGIDGPASYQLEKIFLEDWTFSTGENVEDRGCFESKVGAADDECAIVASGPDCNVNCSHDILFQLISIAKERVWIQTPYFIPPPSICAALRAAVLRGVEVKIILPRKNDIRLVRLASRSYYQSLLESGVLIFEYTKSMLHSKVTIVDGYVFIGSSNIDSRSFRLNFELGCLVKSEIAIKGLTQIFAEDLLNSVNIKKADIQNISKWTQIKDSFAHLLSPLI